MNVRNATRAAISAGAELDIQIATATNRRFWWAPAREPAFSTLCGLNG